MIITVVEVAGPLLDAAASCTETVVEVSAGVGEAAGVGEDAFDDVPADGAGVWPPWPPRFACESGGVGDEDGVSGVGDADGDCAV